MTTTPFAVDDLIAAGRALNAAAERGEVANVKKAQEVVDTLSAYVASLPPADQQAIAKDLVEKLAQPMQFTATVAPKKKTARGSR